MGQNRPTVINSYQLELLHVILIAFSAKDNDSCIAPLTRSQE